MTQTRLNRLNGHVARETGVLAELGAPYSLGRTEAGTAFWGLLAGIFVGLFLGLAVAVAVSKVPVPFVKKDLVRTEVDDFRERLHNERWDPNAPLADRRRDSLPRGSAVAPIAVPPASAVTHLGVDPEDIDGPDESPEVVELDPYEYFIQTGAFESQAEADGMRSRIQGTGFNALVVNRMVSGRMRKVVRVGPLQGRSDAEQLKLDLDAAGCRCTLVRVER